ncbi:MAG: hypothetical protein IJO06_05685 [Thermoguttaceae bacterium]|nr:hypothetical protein [Thermoguttaceae bacterium]MBQ7110694.1 hypothetical protein [Thermoguttaceae bacterium]
MNANTKPQTVAPIETTTFDVALRHMKNGGFALARLYQNDALSLCYFDRERKTVQRLAFWKSTKFAEEIFAPYANVVAATWVLLRPDAFVRNPVETATDEAVRATFDEYVAPALSVAAESAEAIETALAEELDAILGTPPTDAARPTEPEPTNGDDVAGSAGYVC